MSNSIFGWEYPAGAKNDPRAPYNQHDEEIIVTTDEEIEIVWTEDIQTCLEVEVEWVFRGDSLDEAYVTHYVGSRADAIGGTKYLKAFMDERAFESATENAYVQHCDTLDFGDDR